MFNKNGEYGFKFELGDTVKHKTQEIDYKDGLRWGSTGIECRYFIIERLLQQCPGGTQRHYLCRAVTKTNVSVSENDSKRLNEIEIVLSEPFKKKDDK